MNKIIITFFCFSLSLTSFGQSGYINDYWPKQPNLGDTLFVACDGIFPVTAANGQSCANLIGNSDTIINSEIIIDAYYDICYIAPPANGCSRKDTFTYLINDTGLTSFLIKWNIRGTLCVPFNSTVWDSARVNFSTTSIEKLERLNFSISPNPTTYFLRIQNHIQIPINRIQIWDLSGRLVKELKYEQKEVDVSDLSSGVYVLRVLTKKGSNEMKLVKQ